MASSRCESLVNRWFWGLKLVHHHVHLQVLLLRLDCNLRLTHSCHWKASSRPCDLVGTCLSSLGFHSFLRKYSMFLEINWWLQLVKLERASGINGSRLLLWVLSGLGLVCSLCKNFIIHPISVPIRSWNWARGIGISNTLRHGQRSSGGARSCQRSLSAAH
jgi:hypothetical protein